MRTINSGGTGSDAPRWGWNKEKRLPEAIHEDKQLVKYDIENGKEIYKLGFVWRKDSDAIE